MDYSYPPPVKNNYISFSEIYDIICLYYYSFSVDTRAYPYADVSQEWSDIFSPKRKKALKTIYEFTDGAEYIPFNDFPQETETEKEIIVKMSDDLKKMGYKREFYYQRQTFMYNKPGLRIIALYEDRRYTFNQLAKDTYDYLAKCLYWYELTGGDCGRFPDLYMADKSEVTDIFKNWCKEEGHNFETVKESLEELENLSKIDILGNLNREVVSLANSQFIFKNGIKYFFRQSNWNNMKNAYKVYLDFLDTKSYLLKLAHLDFDSKKALEEAFRDTFYKHINKAAFRDYEDKLPQKYVSTI